MGDFKELSGSGGNNWRKGPTDGSAGGGRGYKIPPLEEKRKPKYTEENLRAEMREVNPILYDRCIELDFNIIKILKEMGCCAWARSYAGPTELMRKAYYQLHCPGSLYYEE